MLTLTNNQFTGYTNPRMVSTPISPVGSTILAPNHDAGSSYLHATLEQIDILANEDVEMQAPISEYATFLVLDTNILLHHFEVLAQFVDDAERLSLPVTVIVPGVVVYELDRQKNRNGLAWFARRATSWLLGKIRERKYLKGQAQEETCKSTRNWKIKEEFEVSNSEMFNDNLILDCCLYFSRLGRPTFLCSGDNNLCITSQTQGIQTITLSQYGGSREIAWKMYGDKVDPMRFSPFRGYRGGRREASPALPSVVDDDDRMAVDDEDPAALTEWKSEHPVNMLHEAVIDHFYRLLVELVGKVGGEEVRQRSTAEEEANGSRHAPRRRPYTEWSVADCVEFLIRKAQDSRREGMGSVMIRQANPKAEVFLLKAYTRGVAGSRTGREWSRKDWQVALNNLRDISSAWNDVSICESLLYLEPYVDYVFYLPLRAT